MRDKDLYQHILGIRSPWQVAEVELDLKAEVATVHVALEPETVLMCPECSLPCPSYNRRERRWRHLDTCQFRSVLTADVPRVECPEHGVCQIALPWAEAGSGITALFEAPVIDWRREHRELLALGDTTLMRTQFYWLTNPQNMTREKWLGFKVLRESALKTAKAWALKETAMGLWHHFHRGWADRAWRGWLRWVGRSRQEPVKKVVAMIWEYLWGIINAIVLKVHNGGVASINSRIKLVKMRARGFRKKKRFINAIYFHLGGLDLHPATIGVRFTHTDQ